MGWRCNKCGNTEDFTEVNTVNTEVSQEKDSTKILGIRNTYRNEAALNVWCNRCDGEDVVWKDVAGQDDSHLNK